MGYQEKLWFGFPTTDGGFEPTYVGRTVPGPSLGGYKWYG